MAKMKITLAGTGGSSRTRIPLEAKVYALQLRRGGSSAREAIEQMESEFDLALKPSYTKHASSHLARFATEVGKKVLAGDETATRLCEEAGVEFNYEPAE